MTPRIYYKIAQKAEANSKRLSHAGAYLLVLGILFGLANAMLADELIAITLTPIGLLFLIFGIGIVKIWYKDEGEVGVHNFDSFWRSKNIIVKLYLLFSSLFITFWFFGVIIITIFSVIHSVLVAFK